MSMIFAIVLGIIFIIAIIILVSLHSTAEPSNWKTFTKSRLKEIDDHTDFKNYLSMKSAVIDLDTLLDHVMKKSGIAGGTMGDRLKSARNYFDRTLYDELWSAHKVRNQLVHEPAFKPSLARLQSSRQALKEAILKVGGRS